MAAKCTVEFREPGGDLSLLLVVVKIWRRHDSATGTHVAKLRSNNRGNFQTVEVSKDFTLLNRLIEVVNILNDLHVLDSLKLWIARITGCHF